MRGRNLFTRLWRALVADAAGLRQGLAALAVSSLGDLIAGATLGALTGTLDRLPGLLVLVPAAIGMRGNIFGALGSRLGTAIHAGTFSLTRRRDTVVGQNVLAATTLTLILSVALAFLAKTIAAAFGLPTISVADFVVVSLLGGVLSSIFVLGLSLVIAAQSERRGWDMDNVASPLITAAGDMVTLPSLVLAALLVDRPGVTPAIGTVATLLAAAGVVAAWRTGLPLLRRIVIESLPVLLVAGMVDVVAGITIEKRLEHFLKFPALLVLIPPFLEDTGALGGIVASRLGTKLHLGTVEPRAWPPRAARDDMVLAFLFAVPTFTLVGLSADLLALLFRLDSPGTLVMMQVSLIGGLISTAIAVLIVYYGSIAAYRLGLDPDNHGVPLITSSMDLIGAVTLILTLVAFGVGS